MYRYAFILSLLLICVSISRAQEPLSPMQSHLSSLKEGQSEIWFYRADFPTTILVETRSGTLDPRLELLNAVGDIITSNDDFAPNFSSTARLNVPAGEFSLRVRSVTGEGDYQISAVVGEMQPQWASEFPADFPAWALPNALPLEDSLQLQTPLTTTRLFTPNFAPQRADLYLQMRFRWGQVRAESHAGLSLRSRTEANGQIAGIRLESTPSGNWVLLVNDGQGGENELASGQLPAASGESITLGLLAKGQSVWALAEGQLLAEVETGDFAERTLWGVLIYDAQIFLEELQVATAQTPPPAYPAQIRAWEASESNLITAELVEAGVLPADGSRRLVVPNTEYMVTGIEQRNFLVTEESVRFDNVVIGGDMQVLSGTDVGCGFVARFNSREEKAFAYSDTQGGAGLLWWRRGIISLNQYDIFPSPDPLQNRLIFILQDQFAALYVDGERVMQGLIPLRAGNVGVGFANFAGGNATCRFRNIWVWQ